MLHVIPYFRDSQKQWKQAAAQYNNPNDLLNRFTPQTNFKYAKYHYPNVK